MVLRLSLIHICILSAGLISAVLAMQLPGPGTIYLGQELKFTRPVRFGDTVTATCTVSEIRAEKNIVKLDTTCTNQHLSLIHILGHGLGGRLPEAVQHRPLGSRQAHQFSVHFITSIW